MTIFDFDFRLIYEYFASLHRQGPGSPQATLKALSFIENLTPQSHIADLGCGTGGQTLVLGQHTPGHITGLELSSDFVEIFNRNAAQLSLQDNVKGMTGSMDNLPFKKASLDLIWSEGAIYNIGFERSLKEWREYLKKGGYVAVTDAIWFTDERPAEIHDFWMLHYPQIDTIPAKVAQMQQAGYIPVATFILPENCWTENYFIPATVVQEQILAKYPGNKGVEEFVVAQRREASLYNQYKEFYGYVFYIGKKREGMNN
ncbi:MAG: class I SAM-dependent methyltransferase [Bacteroides sp.]|nr:class I SAM-dependent methyltransferase [Bacteroides sp.]